MSSGTDKIKNKKVTFLSIESTIFVLGVLNHWFTMRKVLMAKVKLFHHHNLLSPPFSGQHLDLFSPGPRIGEKQKFYLKQLDKQLPVFLASTYSGTSLILVFIY